MAAVLSFIFVLAISLLIVKIATVALVHTGVSQSLARFQARSAFSGTGFTTAEAEKIVEHPVRRRIISLLMIVRNAGLITAISSLILSFVNVTESADGLIRVLLLAFGVAVLWLAASSSWFDQHLSRYISWALNRWTHIENYDFEDLLNLSGEYRIYEIQVDEDDWLADRTLEELKLPEEGVYVLGIHRHDGHYVGVPKSSTRLNAGDRAVLYGKRERLRNLDKRKSGSEGESERQHAERDHQRDMKKQDRKENAG